MQTFSLKGTLCSTQESIGHFLWISNCFSYTYICLLPTTQEVKETPSRTTRSTPQKTSQSSSQVKTPQKSRQSSSQSKSPQKTSKSGDSSKSQQKKSPSPQKTSPSGATPKGDGEKRRGNPSYRSYLTREGPRALGTKDIPEVRSL